MARLKYYYQDFKRIIPEKLQNQKGITEVFFEMLKGGSEIMKKYIKNEASEHIETGDLYKNIVAVKPFENKKKNALMAKVTFVRGKKGEIFYQNRQGMIKEVRFGADNWIKAFRLEYGTQKQKPTPILRPAVELSKQPIENFMQTKFKELIKN